MRAKYLILPILLTLLVLPAPAIAQPDAGPPPSPDAGPPAAPAKPSWETPDPPAKKPDPAPEKKPETKPAPAPENRPAPETKPTPTPAKKPKPAKEPATKKDPSVMELDKMTVVGTKKNEKITNTDISVEKFQIEELAQIPTFMGEKDIMKTLQLTPGITTITEGRSGFVVRGSGIDQNLILMDGMPIYYTSHMEGLYSVFNSDAVESLVIYKGGTPARYGTRSASALSVKMIGDEINEFKAKLGIGLITSKLALQVPIIKGKLWASIAGRSSYLSIGNIHDLIKDDCEEGDANAKSGKGGACTRASGGVYASKGGGATGGEDFYFFGRPESWYDINPKLVWKVTEDHSLNLTGFFSEDNSILIGEVWSGTRAGALKWNAQWTDALLSETTGYFSEYFTKNVTGIYHFSSGIKTGGARHHFTWFPFKEMTVTTGFDIEYQDYNHGELEDTTQDDGGKFMPHMQSLEAAVHAGVQWKDIFPGLSAYLGLRYSLFFRLGPGDTHQWDPSTNEAMPGTTIPHGDGEVMATHHNPEPRFNVTYAFNDANSLKFTYNRSAQYLRLMTNSMQLTWYDIWMPSTENIPSMTTDQVGLGYFASLLSGTKWQIDASVEGYYKDHNNVADFEDGLHNYLVDNLEAYVATGDGRSYGLELMLKKQKGWLTGWLSYNLGRSEQKIDGINRGEWYPSKFDKTHDFTALLSVEPLSQFVKGHKLYFTALFILSTGNAVTLPEGYYYISGIPFPYWDGRNRYRLPTYHRLDLGLKYQVDIWRTLKTTFEVNLYNVYDRRNVNSITYSLNTASSKAGSSYDPNKPLYNPYGISYYGFRPSATLTVEY